MTTRIECSICDEQTQVDYGILLGHPLRARTLLYEAELSDAVRQHTNKHGHEPVGQVFVDGRPVSKVVTTPPSTR